MVNGNINEKLPELVTVISQININEKLPELVTTLPSNSPTFSFHEKRPPA
jgi:hypothetical protein